MLHREKLKKGRFWDIFFLSTYPVGIAVILITLRQGDAIGGSALGGKVVGGKFLLLVDSTHFKVVSGVFWLTDLTLSLLAMCLGLLMLIGMGYFFFRYLVPYVSRSFKGSDRKL